jgi:uncharacterized membrane protein
MKIKLVAPTIPQLMMLVNIAGMILSVFMWRNALAGQVIGCVTGKGCEIVLHSAYAKIFGVPIAAYGFAFYGVNALVTLFRLFDDRPILRLTTWKFSGISIIASAYFLYLEIFVIHAFCSWCTVSTFLTIFLLLLSVVEMKKFDGIKGAITEVKTLLGI